MEEKTVVDYIPLKTRLRPVGRLDQNTTGLFVDDKMMVNYKII